MDSRTIGALILSLCLCSWSNGPTTHRRGVEWHQGTFETAASQALSSGRDLLVYFWSDTSHACGRFYQGPLQDERVVEATKPFVCLGLQLETDGSREIFETYSVRTLPSILVIDPSDRRAQDGIYGEITTPVVMRRLQRIARDEETLRDYERRTDANPDDLELRGAMANLVASLGNHDRAERLRESIRTDDPQGESDVAASMYYREKLHEIMGGSMVLSPDHARALTEYVQTIVPHDTRRRGWDQVATVQNALGNRKGEMVAWREAFPLVRDEQLFNWGWSKVLWWWSNRDVLSKKDKEFALEVARKTAAVSERLSEEDPAYYDPAIFLTRRLNTLAMALYMNDEGDEARAVIERCTSLHPSNAEFAARLEAYADEASDGYFSPYSDYDASWSPNGKKIIFTSTRDRNAELYVADLKKGSLQRITRCLASDDQATFRPTGKFIAFRSDRFETSAVYRAKLDGDDCTLLVPIRDGRGYPAASGMPSYSKDAKWLALLRDEQGSPRAMLANANGEDSKPISAHGDGEATVAWAGAQLVYSGQRDGQQDILIANADGSEERNLTPARDDSWDADASASLDGERIVFARWRNGQSDIWTVNADGSGLTQLTDGPEQDRRPRFSPNGKSIVFDRAGADGNSRLWIMKANGKSAAPLLDG